MLYNKNIILHILSSKFGDKIETYIQDCIVRMESNELGIYLGQEADYAVLDTIVQMTVQDFETETEEEKQTAISGTLEVLADISGYVHWDDEEIYVGNSIVTIGLLYEFYAENDEYTNLYLEHIY